MLAFFCLFLLWEFTAVCAGAKCGYPGSPAFGRPAPIYGLYEEGKTVTYTCNNGYSLMAGQPTRVCLPNGTWSGVLPICDTSLTALDYDFSRDTWSYLAVDGNKTTCFRDYGWDSNPEWQVYLKGNHHVVSVAITVPTKATLYYYSVSGVSDDRTRITFNRCATFNGTSESYDCGNPERPAHGFIVNAPFGESEYRCVAGYRLLGPIRRLCQWSSGHWTGPQPVCQEIICKELNDLPNGSVQVTGPSASRAVQGSKAFYTCDAGYRLSGNGTRTCLENSSWSGEDPFCQQIVCKDLSDLPNGSVQVTGPSGSRAVQDSEAFYTCDAGYRLSGNGTRTCLENSSWSGEDPFCQQIVCKDLSDLPNGSVQVTGPSGSRAVQGSEAFYTCDAGYRLSGNGTRTCLENSSWSGEDPFCQPISQSKLDGGGGLPTGAVVSTVAVILLLLLLSIVLLVLFLMKRSNNGAGYYADQDGSSHQNEPFNAELQKREESHSTELCASSSNPSTRTGTSSLTGRPSGSRWALSSFWFRSKTEWKATSRKSSMSSRVENIYEEPSFRCSEESSM